MRKLRLRPKQLDLLAGCPPCQGFSRLRTLNGSVPVDDARNDLLSNFQNYVEVLQPKAVMMENVPGLANDNRFSSFCHSLDRLGYRGDFRILDVADYGVPQRRRRLIFLAGYGTIIPFGRAIKRRPTVRDALSDLPTAGKSGDPAHDIPEHRSARVRHIIRNIPKDGGSRASLPSGDAVAVPHPLQWLHRYIWAPLMGLGCAHYHQRLFQPFEGPLPPPGRGPRYHYS